MSTKSKTGKRCIEAIFTDKTAAALSSETPTKQESEKEAEAPSPPPDGGLIAWLQVVAGHLVIFNTWGNIMSFGIFQPYYEARLSLDPAAVSWIGSVQICLTLLIGTVSGRLFDAGHLRPLLAGGGLLQLVGILVTSIIAGDAVTNTAVAAPRYWQLFLAQGICQGLGCGIVFAPVIANIATYFAQRRSLAICVSACGGATGGIVFPLIASRLLYGLGLAWTLRVMALVVLTAYLVVLACVRTRLAPRKSGPLIDLTAFRETAYLLFAMSMFITLWATYFVYYYVRAYAVNVLGASQTTSFNMLVIINAVGIPGRLIPAYLADRYFGTVDVFLPTVFGMAICVFAWASIDSVVAEYVWIVWLGYFGAGIQGMFPATLAGLTKDLSKNGTRIGMIFSFVSIAALTGPPIAGKLIDLRGGSYLGAQIWGGICLLVGGLILAAAQWCSKKEAK